MVSLKRWLVLLKILRKRFLNHKVCVPWPPLLAEYYLLCWFGLLVVGWGTCIWRSIWCNCVSCNGSFPLKSWWAFWRWFTKTPKHVKACTNNKCNLITLGGVNEVVLIDALDFVRDISLLGWKGEVTGWPPYQRFCLLRKVINFQKFLVSLELDYQTTWRRGGYSTYVQARIHKLTYMHSYSYVYNFTMIRNLVCREKFEL
jgi:hypothetical protein